MSLQNLRQTFSSVSRNFGGHPKFRRNFGGHPKFRLRVFAKVMLKRAYWPERVGKACEWSVCPPVCNYLTLLPLLEGFQVAKNFFAFPPLYFSGYECSKNNFGFHSNRKTQGQKHEVNNLYFKYQICQMK